MSKLMWIAGILLVAAGVALGLMVFLSPTSIVGWGITPEVAVVLLVGGILSIGLGGVINAIYSQPMADSDTQAYAPHVAVEASTIPEFGRRAAEAAATTAAAGTRVATEVSEPVKETIEALEEARQNIERAFGPQPEEAFAVPETIPQVSAAPEPEETEAAPEEEPVAEEEVDEQEPVEGQLYVVEERFIRARPARILSDGTVEAETDEGWMRFENLEHLDEYLDAMAPAAR